MVWQATILDALRDFDRNHPSTTEEGRAEARLSAVQSALRDAGFTTEASQLTERSLKRHASTDGRKVLREAVSAHQAEERNSQSYKL